MTHNGNPGLMELASHMTSAPAPAFVLGLTDTYTPVCYDSEFAPHIAIAGNTGIGKTTMLRLLLAQALRRGTRVILCDPKRAHQWCHHHDGVSHATSDEAIWHAILDLSYCRLFGGSPDRTPIILAIDDQPVVMTRMLAYESADTGHSATEAFADILTAGRSAGITVMSTAGMFSAAAFGQRPSQPQMAQYAARLVGPTTSAGRKLLGPDVTDSPQSTNGGVFDLLTPEWRTRIHAGFLAPNEARDWANGI